MKPNSNLRNLRNPRGTLLRVMCVALAAMLLVAGLGCFQLETLIQLQPDGGATITERLQFSQQLLNLGATQGGDLDVAAMLEKPAALERAGRMGKGVELVSHQIRHVGADRECVTVFKIADIRELRYSSPFLAFIDYRENNVLKADMFPVYESTWYGRVAGQMAVTFKPAKEPKAEPSRKEGEPPPPGPSPKQLQAFRELQPLVRDMLLDAKVKVTFESYAPLRFRMYFRYRDMRAGTRRFELIDFSGKDLDQFSMPLLDNEEVMLELLQGRFGGANLVETVKEHGTNATLPVYHPRGIPEIYFRPSREMFKAYFEGKTLKFDKRDGGDRPANFDEVGFKGENRRPTTAADSPRE